MSSLEEQKSFLKEEMALHFLLQVDADKARRAILNEPIEDTDPEEQEMMDLAADPYFGTVGGPDGLPPMFTEGPPTEFGGLEEANHPVPDMMFPAFPVFGAPNG
jgi:hypothetical protein